MNITKLYNRVIGEEDTYEFDYENEDHNETEKHYSEWFETMGEAHAEGYNKHLAHTQKELPTALERIVDSFIKRLCELERTANTIGGDAEAVRQVILEEINDLQQIKTEIKNLNK